MARQHIQHRHTRHGIRSETYYGFEIRDFLALNWHAQQVESTIWDKQMQLFHLLLTVIACSLGNEQHKQPNLYISNWAVIKQPKV